MKALGFAAALAAGAMIAGPVSAFTYTASSETTNDFSLFPLVPPQTQLYVYLTVDSDLHIQNSQFYSQYYYYYYRADGSLDYANNTANWVDLPWTLQGGVYTTSFYTAGEHIRTELGEGTYRIAWLQDQRFHWDGYNIAQAGGDWTLTITDAPIASVPEPSSWALMIAGFGLAGAGLRSARRRGAVAA